MKIVSLDPAGKSFGFVGIEYDQQKLDLFLDFTLKSPKEFNADDRLRYTSSSVATLISLIKPDMIVSEKPWGMGFSSQTLKELIGAIKSEIWTKIEWQSVSEARRAVLGDTWGGADKRVSSDWLLQYPWNIRSKNRIKALLDSASNESDDGFDELDAILHGLCYLIHTQGLVPVIKEKKSKKNKKDG